MANSSFIELSSLKNNQQFRTSLTKPAATVNSSVNLTQKLRKVPNRGSTSLNQSTRMYAGTVEAESRPTTTAVTRELSNSLYFGTEKAAIRAYAPQVIENNREFWVGKKSIN